MSKKPKKPPHVLFVDQDPNFHGVLNYVLKQLGLTAEGAKTPEDFLEKLKKTRPDVCIIDLNVGSLGIGFTIVEAVRRVMGHDLPLFVISKAADTQSIAHALELGANDFIVKPVTREILASKLAFYVVSEQLADSRLPFVTPPMGNAPAYMRMNYDVTEIDEFGAKLVGPHLLAKGMSLRMEGDIAKEISNDEKSLLMTVRSNWIEDDSKRLYGAYAEFDLTNEVLLKNVRHWLAEKG